MIPQVVILLGPSGVGKTTIGHLLERRFLCQFISLEAFFLSRYPIYELYRSHRAEAYQLFATHIHETLNQSNVPTVFEEVGLSSYAQTLIHTMRSTYRTVLVKILASETLCEQRISQRGTRANFPKRPGIGQRVRSQFLAEVATQYHFAAEIENEDLPEEVILNQLCHIFSS